MESNGKTAKADKPERARGRDAVRLTERSSILHLVSSALNEAGMLLDAINPHYGESTMSDEVFHTGLGEALDCLHTGAMHLLRLHESQFGVSETVIPVIVDSSDGRPGGFIF